jgi:hypothetical protein
MLVGSFLGGLKINSMPGRPRGVRCNGIKT